MNGSVTINGTKYPVTIADLTPADVLPVFRTDTSILKTDSILLHAAGAEQNSAKKVLLPHLVSILSASIAEDVVLTIESYYDEGGAYKGMYWHFNGQWLRRTDTGEMIRVDDTAAEIAMAADIASRAAVTANTAAAGADAKAALANTAATNANTKAALADEKATLADEKATLANEKATLADEKATLAQTQAGYAKQQGDYAKQQGDYAKQQGDYAKRRGDYPDQIRSDGYVWTYDPDDAAAGTDGYKRTAYKVDAALDFDALTPEQYKTLIDDIKAGMVFATVATCESIIDELT